MKIKITVFKESGKYYTEDIIDVPRDIPIWKEDFKEFIKENNPVDIGEGFLLTEDVGEEKQSFHYALWKYNDIIG